MLARQLVGVREIGDSQAPYWTAASPDGVHILVEPGETVLHVCYCRVSQLKQQPAGFSPKPSQLLPQAWEFPDLATVVITDRRVAFLTTGFDKGGGWTGFGAVGIAVAVAGNAVSRSRAAKRSAGKVAIGQIRHEWLTWIGIRYRKPVFGLDTYIHLAAATVAGTTVIQLYKPGVITEDLARSMVGTVAGHRLPLMQAGSAEAAALTDYQSGGMGAVQGANPGDLRWPLPGNPEELIATLIGQQRVP